jgi:hypothetical protein
LKNFSITGRVEHVGPNRFTAMACAVSNETGRAARGEALIDDADSSHRAQLRVYELVVTLTKQITRRGDRVASIEVA